MEKWEDMIRDMSNTTIQAPEVMEVNSVHLNWCYAAKNVINTRLACPERVCDNLGEWHRYAKLVLGA